MRMKHFESETLTSIPADVKGGNPPALKQFKFLANKPSALTIYQAFNVWHWQLCWVCPGTVYLVQCRSQTISCKWCSCLLGNQVFLQAASSTCNKPSDCPCLITGLRGVNLFSVSPADNRVMQSHLQILRNVNFVKVEQKLVLTACYV